MRRRLRNAREQELIIVVAVITLLLTLTVQAFYRWLTTDSWQASTLDWVHVPGYSVATFIQAVERIENGDPGSLVIREVELSGPAEVRGRHKVKDLYELLMIADAYPDQVMIMRFLVEGPLSYHQFAEFSRIAPIQDITRRYLFSEISVMKKARGRLSPW